MFLQVTQANTVRMTSTSATLILATMALVKMVLLLSPATAALATPAACAKPTSMNVSVSLVRTVAPARTERTPTSAPVLKGPQVRLRYPITFLTLKTFDIIIRNIYFYFLFSTHKASIVRSTWTTAKASPATMGGVSTKSMAMSVHASQVTQVSFGWSLQVQGVFPRALGGGGETGGWRVLSFGTIVSDCLCGTGD